MNLQVNKKNKAYQALVKASREKNLSLADFMDKEAHTDEVCDIIYKNMNMALRMVLSKDKFKTMFVSEKSSVIDLFKNAA